MKKIKQFKPLFSSTGFKPAKTFNGRAHIDAMYDETWEKYSRAFLAINIKCYSCGNKSEVTDHLIPHKGDEILFKKTDNHIPLCHKCHNTITTLFDRHHKPGSKDINKKLRWIAANRSRFDVATRVKVLATYGK